MLSSESQHIESFTESNTVMNPMSEVENTTSLLSTVNSITKIKVDGALQSLPQSQKTLINSATEQLQSVEQKEIVTGIATSSSEVINMASLLGSTSSIASSSSSHSNSAFSLLRHRISKWDNSQQLTTDTSTIRHSMYHI